MRDVRYVGPHSAHEVVVDGWSVPLIHAHPCGEHDDKVMVVIDNRLEDTFTVAEAERFVPFLADAIAVALGYASHPNENTESPLVRCPQPRPVRTHSVAWVESEEREVVEVIGGREIAVGGDVVPGFAPRALMDVDASRNDSGGCEGVSVSDHLNDLGARQDRADVQSDSGDVLMDDLDDDGLLAHGVDDVGGQLFPPLLTPDRATISHSDTTGKGFRRLLLWPLRLGRGLAKGGRAS